MRKSLILSLLLLAFLGPLSAQRGNMKGHVLISGLGGIRLQDQNTQYQLIGRGMVFTRNWLAWGAEAAFTQNTGQFRNFDAGNLGGFAHIKLPLGFYGEGGIATGFSLSQRRADLPARTGLFYAAGFSKRLLPALYADVQYRRFPKGVDDIKFNNGIRFGLSVKF